MSKKRLFVCLTLDDIARLRSSPEAFLNIPGEEVGLACDLVVFASGNMDDDYLRLCQERITLAITKPTAH